MNCYLFIVDKNITQYGNVDSNLCTVTYESLKDTLRYMINRDAGGSSGTSGGTVVKRVEAIRIEVSYSADGTDTVNGWQSLLDWYEGEPDLPLP